MPEECVQEQEYTGKVAIVDAYYHTKSVGKWSNVSSTIGDTQFVRKVVSHVYVIGERAKRARHYQGCTNSSLCGIYIYIYIYICMEVRMPY